MELKKLLKVFKWISVGGISFLLLCLITNGAGDQPAAFTTYLLCCSIILSSCLLSMALSANKEDNKE